MNLNSTRCKKLCNKLAICSDLIIKSFMEYTNNSLEKSLFPHIPIVCLTFFIRKKKESSSYVHFKIYLLFKRIIYIYTKWINKEQETMAISSTQLTIYHNTLESSNNILLFCLCSVTKQKFILVSSISKPWSKKLNVKQFINILWWWFYGYVLLTVYMFFIRFIVELKLYAKLTSTFI